MAKIVDFLDNLAADPDLEARYYDDPEAVMTEAGLTDEQQALIREGRIEPLRTEILKELGADVKVIMIKWVWPPGPQPKA